MINAKAKMKWAYLGQVMICLLIIFSFATSGCTPLRRKFTRKKKQEVIEEEAPILEPIEYPKKVYSVQELYKHHFELWKVWQKELITSMTEEASRKRQVYMFNQAILNLETAKDLLTADKQKILSGYIDKLNRIKEDYMSPVPTTTSTSMKSALESLEKKVKKDFTFKVIEKDVVSK